MPQPKNHFLRIFIPTVLTVVAIGFSILVFVRTGNKTPAPTDPQTATNSPANTPPITPADPATPALPTAAATPTTITPADPAQPAPTGTPSAAPGTPAAAVGAFQVRYFSAAESGDPGILGSRAKDGPEKQLLDFSDVGAGLDRLELANHFDTIKDVNHVAAQLAYQAPGGGLQIPFSAFQVGVADGENATLTWLNVRAAPVAEERVWRNVPSGKPGEFEAFIIDGDGNPVLRLSRTYSILPGSYDISLFQRIENQSGRPLTVIWKQFGPTELHQDAKSYGGDKRKMRFGYLLDPSKDPSRITVVSGDHELDHPGVTGKAAAWGIEKQVWPTVESSMEAQTLVWSGVTNRYFGVAVHSLYDVTLKAPDKSLGWVDTLSAIVPPGSVPGFEHASIIITSKPATIAPGAATDLSMGVFAGPMDRRLIRSEPLLAGLNLHELVVYNFGGMCGWCTFGALTQTLLGLLHILHDYVFRDWALAIIFLVVIVRTCLHPVTRWSQIRMQKFGKQMQAVGPKQKQLQEKYSGDPKKLQEETAKLWREEGISPAGMLGCLPMFLQTPVWIALYAVLYFAVELRHEHAFFGLFQNIQPQSSPFWWFLGDLAEPDRFWFFAENTTKPWEIPLLGPLTSFNILPIILGVVFFIQQKYLTPPTAATLTPEQEMQQKMIKWMTVFMFPIFMYNAPSGLALYFIANSTLGIFESRWIRSHITKTELLNPPPKPGDGPNPRAGKPSLKPGGFMARMQALAEQKQREAVEKGRQAHKKKK